MVLAVFAPGRSWALTCGFTISDMSFGSEVDTLLGSAIDTTATLQYPCSGATVADLRGSWRWECRSSGSTRRMIGGGDSHLLYQMHQNLERTRIWGGVGSADPPPPVAFNLDNNGAATNGAATGDQTIYGRISDGQASARPTTYGSNFTGGDVDIRYGESASSDFTIGPESTGDAVSFSVDGRAQNRTMRLMSNVVRTRQPGSISGGGMPPPHLFGLVA